MEIAPTALGVVAVGAFFIRLTKIFFCLHCQLEFVCFFNESVLNLLEMSGLSG